MALLSVTSPHIHKPGNTGSFMRQVLYATVPGLFMLTYFFGFGTLINVALACAVAVSCEAIILKARNKPISFYLNDYSAVVTAVLLALAIPPHVTLVVNGYRHLICHSSCQAPVRWFGYESVQPGHGGLRFIADFVSQGNDYLAPGHRSGQQHRRTRPD